MGGLSVVRGIIGGVAGAAGDPQTQQQMAAANQQAAQQKQNELKAKIAPLSLGVKNLQTGIQGAYSSYRQAHPEFDGDFDQWKTGPGAQQFQQFTDQTQQVVHSMREILHPDHQSGPTDWLKTHLTDRMHITSADHRAEDVANDAAWNKYDESQFTQGATKVTPWDEQPAQKAQKQKTDAAQALEKQKTDSAQALELQKTKYGLDLETKKAEAAQKIEAQKEIDRDKIEQGREGERAKHEAAVQERFNASQERIERDHDKAQGALGSWTVVEGENGSTKLLNSKTGQMQDAPAGLHKSGYYAKQVAPLEAATLNIKSYMDGGQFTGPGDLDLQHQYFTATQPATGFRMTKVQQDILANSQSFLNQLKAKSAHFGLGTLFSDEQRKQIAAEAQNAIEAKKQALNVGGPKTDQLRGMQGGASDDDIIKALTKK